MDNILSLLSSLLCCILPFVLIFGIAFWASKSREKKQNTLLAQVPPNAEFKAVLRYNFGNQQSKFWKMKAFQGSGVLYVLDDKIHYITTNNPNDNFTFDLKTSQINWIGVNLTNGLLEWFQLKNGEKDYYFNVETGMFIFNINSKKMKTTQVFNYLKEAQKKYQ
ncbi:MULTISPECIES: hypothetical protein [Empedobacter]|uniref:Uncharacterized protein n=1 Tax=Empedobacter falsenii TaxID=343874 RepID=A0A3R8Z9X2_9FLAO|nr:MULTISPECIES: hypothetical protein [Empedobacter]MDH0673437.1 hypothetical protein [Empedobacter sp. GD03861]RRT93506.1 hypothetical protein EGI89_03635 [Empedobacter falsenii]RRT93652.1 hypothetical protein EGI88_03645 [Empedobacter falsenii]